MKSEALKNHKLQIINRTSGYVVGVTIIAAQVEESKGYFCHLTNLHAFSPVLSINSKIICH